MATFRFGRDVNMKWNGNEIVGPAGTIFRIEDAYYDEFNNSVGHAEPTLEWLVTNELAVVQANVAGLPVSATDPISATTTTSGTNISLAVGTTPANYVLASNGAGGASFIAAAGAGVSSITGTAPIAASASTGAVTLSLNANYSTSTHLHDGTYQVAGNYSTSTHTHTSFANNLQINKANSKVQLLNTTSGSGTEDGMYLLMADTDVGYLWNAETNGAIVFGTGGAERARITPAGKFGIGTSTPSHQLEVVGPASVTVGVSAGGAGFAELELVGQAGKNYITSDDTLSFDIGGTERATVSTTGLNVTSGTLSQGGTAVSLSGHTHAAGASFPTGVIFPYIGYAAPTGWLFCDGATYNTSLYPDLASAITIATGGETPGETFSVPDLRDRFLGGYTSSGSGYSTSAGSFGPNNSVAVGAHTHTTNVGHSHTDTFGVSSHASHTHSVDPGATASGGPSATSTLSYAGGSVTATIPTSTHTHSTDIAATTSGGPSATLSHTVTGSVTTLATTNVTSSSVGSVISPKSFTTSFIIKT
jgi:hypothetical protein